jgi:predicted anti-sigma-YlaC factor YlaD
MMRDRDSAMRTCEQIQASLALGEAVEDPRLQEHLHDCPSCRETALALAQVKQGLAVTMEIEPPAELDWLVREALSERPLVTGFLLRPGMAAGLAVAALFALIVTVSTLLAQAGAAEMGPALAVAAVWAYLALCFAATLPLLLQARLRREQHGAEVRT